MQATRQATTETLSMRADMLKMVMADSETGAAYTQKNRPEREPTRGERRHTRLVRLVRRATFMCRYSVQSSRHV